MNKKFPALFIIATIGSICAAFIVYSPAARAYEIPSAGQLPVPPVIAASGSAQDYDFTNSFGSLLSPFENFFNSMKGGNASIPVTLNVGNNASTTITIGIDVQQYINQYISQFDAWFYNATGVHIEWILNIFVNIIYWAIGLANGAVRWIVGLFR